MQGQGGGQGGKRGGWQGLAGHGEASGNQVMFSLLHLKIILFILPFDKFVELFLGARHCARCKNRQTTNK